MRNSADGSRTSMIPVRNNELLIPGTWYSIYRRGLGIYVLPATTSDSSAGPRTWMKCLATYLCVTFHPLPLHHTLVVAAVTMIPPINTRYLVECGIRVDIFAIGTAFICGRHKVGWYHTPVQQYRLQPVRLRNTGRDFERGGQEERGKNTTYVRISRCRAFCCCNPCRRTSMSFSVDFTRNEEIPGNKRNLCTKPITTGDHSY